MPSSAEAMGADGWETFRALLPLPGRAMPKSGEPFRQNRPLARLSHEGSALLGEHLEAVDLRRQLELRNKRIDQAYFVESDIASVVANGAGKSAIEVGIISRERLRPGRLFASAGCGRRYGWAEPI